MIAGCRELYAPRSAEEKVRVRGQSKSVLSHKIKAFKFEKKMISLPMVMITYTYKRTRGRYLFIEEERA